MNKAIFLLFILVFVVCYGRFIAGRDRNAYLIMTFFFIAIPFQFAIPVFKLHINTIGGTLGDSFSIVLPMIFVLYFATHKRFKFPPGLLQRNALVFSLVCLVSLFSFNNYGKLSSLIYLIFVLSHLICFAYFLYNFSSYAIVRALYVAFAFLSILQLFLAICFPLLGITLVTRIFYDVAEQWATRMGTRAGAVGVFTHPGNLALFTSISAMFFISCYLHDFKVRLSKYMLVANILVVLLTFSRTSYLALFVSAVLLYLIFSQAHKNIFSFKNLLFFIFPAVIISIWVVYLSPFSELFLGEDAADMYAARLLHWGIGLEIFQKHYLLGVGLNAHLEYLDAYGLSLNAVDQNNEFILSNPIHSIHLIVLAELGLVGGLLWLYLIITITARGKNYIAYNKRYKKNRAGNILVLTSIGVVVCFIIYGSTGWAPFSPGLFPFFLFFISASFYLFRVASSQRQRRLTVYS